jgi:integrase
MPVEKIAPGRWRIRLRYGAGLRGRFEIVAKTEAAAEARAALMTQMANELSACGKHAEARAVLEEAGAAQSEADLDEVRDVIRELCAEGPVEPGETAPEKKLSSRTTFGQIAELWFSDKLRTEYGLRVKKREAGTISKDRSRLAVLAPVLLNRPIVEVTQAVAKEAMLLVPPEVQTSRFLYEQLIAFVLKQAVNLELIPNYPLRPDFVSQQGKAPLFQYLYTHEEFALVSCQAVPLEYRIAYGLMTREALRPGGVAIVEWDHIDLTTGLMYHKHKTKIPRRWIVSEDVLLVLRAWRLMNPDEDMVFPHYEPRSVPRDLRAHLLLAKVTRAALHNTTDDERQLRGQDLRATHVTLALANGAPPYWVRDRTGHADEATMEIYRRMGREAGEMRLPWLRPLDEALGAELGIPQRTSPLPLPWRRSTDDSLPTYTSTVSVPECMGQWVGGADKTPMITGGIADSDYTRNDTLELTPEPKRATSPASSTTVEHTGPAGFSGVGQDPVELALARALDAATAAGRFDVILELTRELRERRLERTGGGTK